MIRESLDRTPAVMRIAIVIAVEELRPDLSQVAGPNWLTAQHTGVLLEGRPVIHQYEFHVAPPNAKQNTVTDGCTALGGERKDGFDHPDCPYSARPFPEG